MGRRQLLRSCMIIATSLALLACPTAALEPLPAPSGPVILTVTGNVAVTNSARGAEFDRPMLYALGLSKIATTTAWTDGVKQFEGVLLGKVLDRVGATGDLITAIAINDYVAPIPREDVDKYGVLLAATMDGTEMTVRDYGPLWVVYPRDDFPDLVETQNNDRWVWQLHELNVK